MLLATIIIPALLLLSIDKISAVPTTTTTWITTTTTTTTTDHADFDNSISSRPRLRDAIVRANPETDVRFFLYTRIAAGAETPAAAGHELRLGDREALKATTFDPRKSTKFVTHGWRGTYQASSCQSVRKAFLVRDDYNVVAVDWTEFAKLPYVQAVMHIKSVGAQIAKMIDFLESEGNDPNNVTLVGHSLGAHVMGLAGHQAVNKVGHLVALDPAGPGFALVGPPHGLTSDAAKLVEVVHTNVGALGLRRAVGHLDFYANGGGPDQPGCRGNDHLCAHRRSYELYTEAMNSGAGATMPSVRCKDYATFLRGECDEDRVVAFPSADEAGKSGNATPGLYFLRTAATPPYGLGMSGATAEEAVADAAAAERAVEVFLAPGHGKVHG